MARDISTTILTPDETAPTAGWVAVIEGWHIRATDRQHAERIIDACEMTAAIGRKSAQAEMRKALGLHVHGPHVPR